MVTFTPATSVESLTVDVFRLWEEARKNPSRHTQKSPGGQRIRAKDLLAILFENNKCIQKSRYMLSGGELEGLPCFSVLPKTFAYKYLFLFSVVIQNKG